MAEPTDHQVPWLEYAILVAATFLALELKRQFGLFAQHVFSPKLVQSGSPYALSLAEWSQVGAVLAACAVHAWTGLPGAPWLERKLYGWHASEKIHVWRPALVTMLLVMAYTAVYSVVISHLGFSSRLGSQLHGGSLPQAVLVKLALLYPTAAIGAAISEETVYRFAVLSLFLWLVFLVPAVRARRNLAIAAGVILGGLFFGYVHVAENLETVHTGSLFVDVLTTPQSLAGIAFGTVYCRYGLEAAMVTHVACDFAAPFVLKAVQLLHG